MPQKVVNLNLGPRLGMSPSLLAVKRKHPMSVKMYEMMWTHPNVLKGLTLAD